jgi:hypothetical protein
MAVAIIEKRGGPAMRLPLRRSFSARPVRVFSIALATLAAVAGFALTSTGASGATASRTSPARTTKVPKLSHQLCYSSAARGFTIPRGVVLFNRFSPHGFVPKIGRAVMNCNPVIKTVSVPASGTTKTYPITNAAGHLACFSITERRQKPPAPLAVRNQFGTGTLYLGQPYLLCLPTWKSLTSPPKHRVAEPPGLDHFTCYPAQGPNTFVIPAVVKLQDEFDRKPVVATVSPLANIVCAPTIKTVHGKVYKIVHPLNLLVCYPVGPTPIRPRVFDQNQFGHATVIIKRTQELCLPSVRANTP